MSNKIEDIDQLKGYMSKRCEADVHEAHIRSLLESNAIGALLPFISTLGVILLTIFAATQLDQPFGLTHTATLGVYSCLSIMMISTIWGYCFGYAEKHYKDEKECALEVELKTLRGMLSFDVKDGAIVLNDVITIKKDIIEARIQKIQEELAQIRQTKNQPKEETLKNINSTLSSLALGLMTIVATIFASEYLHNVLTSTAAQATTAGIFFAGAGITTLYITYESVLENDKPKVYPWLETVALLVLTIVGTTLAYEYLPNIIQDPLATDIAGAFGAVSSIALILSYIQKNFDEDNKDLVWMWIKPIIIAALAILATIAAWQMMKNHFSDNFVNGTSSAVGIVGLTAAIGSFTKEVFVYDQKVDNYGKRKISKDSIFDKISLDNDVKNCILSWWIPLTIVMIGMVFSGVAITEFASSTAQPYLYTVAILGSLALITSHIFYTCITAKNEEQMKAEAERERNPVIVPAKGR